MVLRFGIALVIMSLFAGCNRVELKTGHYATTSAGVESATVVLGGSAGNITVTPITGDQLFDATIEYIGEITFDEGTNPNRTIQLSENVGNLSFTDRELEWDVKVNRDIPLGLAVAVSSGDVNLNLADFTLTALSVGVSSGSIDLSLPANETPYRVNVGSSSGALNAVLEDGAQVNFDAIQMSSGSFVITTGADSIISVVGTTSSGGMTINLGEGTALDATLSGSSGNVVVDVPEGAAVRLEVVSHSSGAVTVPAVVNKISGEDENEGVWQTEGYDSAEVQINITVSSLSSGSVEIR